MHTLCGLNIMVENVKDARSGQVTSSTAKHMSVSLLRCPPRYKMYQSVFAFVSLRVSSSDRAERFWITSGNVSNYHRRSMLLRNSVDNQGIKLFSSRGAVVVSIESLCSFLRANVDFVDPVVA